MNYRRAMKELKDAGTAQNRRVYARHGVSGPTFGVSYANLNRIKKDALRVPGPRPRYERHDHELALKLWGSGNHDARVLATMVADPRRMKSSELDQWIRDSDNHSLEGAVAGLASRSRFAESKMKKWRRSRSELTSAAGWNLLAEMALHDDSRPDSYFLPYLAEIRDSIHRAANRTRYAMNNALIAIGGRSANLRRRAIAAAKKIGPVEVDHGETGCKTPDAIPYIERMWEGKREKNA